MRHEDERGETNAIPIRDINVNEGGRHGGWYEEDEKEEEGDAVDVDGLAG